MSLQQLTQTHTLTVKRLVVTRDAVGGPIETYTKAARGSRPREVLARATIMKPKERMEHGVRGERQGWKFLMTADPEIDLDDQITFDYVTDQPQTVKVLVGSHALNPSGRLWRVFGEEDTTET